ncbi:hypothetical protein N7520_003671 [Penicillium odoratum]|uniref:uncharacterized protein n=1 Tax=Penicillium odoratum TaxID=1167516 RepID=UPI002548085A|nr:uncharacterized protein N7520_003671 [Penicillium odoratum]KAJ5769112.1 hypothetical protein N7520_003671 [Penicillium odoratum]
MADFGYFDDDGSFYLLPAEPIRLADYSTHPNSNNCQLVFSQASAGNSHSNSNSQESSCPTSSTSETSAPPEHESIPGPTVQKHIPVRPEDIYHMSGGMDQIQLQYLEDDSICIEDDSQVLQMVAGMNPDQRMPALQQRSMLGIPALEQAEPLEGVSLLCGILTGALHTEAELASTLQNLSQWTNTVKRKLNDRKLNDKKLNDRKLNDRKLNDRKLNDRKLNDRKLNDRKLNDRKLIDRKLIDKKMNDKNRVTKRPASKPNMSSVGGSDKKKKAKKFFRCTDCGTTCGTMGASQRHADYIHQPSTKYYCSFCDHVSYRKDKHRDHCRTAHLWGTTDEEINECMEPLNCPPVCKLCPRQTGNWKEFYKCFISHGIIGQPDEDEEVETDDEDDEDVDPAPGNGRTFPPVIGGTNVRLAQGQNEYYPGISNQSWNSFSIQSPNISVNPQAFDMDRSFSHDVGMLAPQPGILHDNQFQKRRAAGHSDILRGVTQLGLPPQHPPKRARQASAESPEHRLCWGCKHQFSGCDLCENKTASVDRCHACPGATIPIASASGSQVARRTAQGQGMNNTSFIIPQGQQQMRHGQWLTPTPLGNNRQMPQQRPGNRRLTGSPQGLPRDPFYHANMVMTLELPDLSEEDLLSPGPKPSDANFGGTWLSCLPIRVPLLGMAKEPSEATVSGLEYGGETISPLGNLPVARIGKSIPNLCGCPCRTKTSYSSNARVELAPGKILDMTLTILPQDRVVHPLRTRVRVVVKLLKLRSSVARAGNKKKNKEDAKAIEEVLKTSLDGSASTEPVKESQEDPVDESDCSEFEDDGLFSDAESVTSSIFEASSVSELAMVPFKRSKPALFHNDEDEDENASDLSPDREPDDTEALQTQSLFQICDYEETELEISMDLDFQTCLERLSTWTDGLADIEYSGHTISDPTRVFEYFFKYIIYVIFALSRSRIMTDNR